MRIENLVVDYGRRSGKDPYHARLLIGLLIGIAICFFVLTHIN